MKRGIFFLLLFNFGIAATTFAQSKARHQKAKPQPARQQTVTTPGAGMVVPQGALMDTVSLMSSSAGQAYGRKRYAIADPTIRMLNARARGENVKISGSGIVGMPNGTYGYGKVLLSRNTAVSSGTTFGSGAVGTGTTLMGVGAGQNTPGFNGKNPDAGPWFWGSKLPLRNLPPPEKNDKNK